MTKSKFSKRKLKFHRISVKNLNVGYGAVNYVTSDIITMQKLQRIKNMQAVKILRFVFITCISFTLDSAKANKFFRLEKPLNFRIAKQTV